MLASTPELPNVFTTVVVKTVCDFYRGSIPFIPCYMEFFHRDDRSLDGMINGGCITASPLNHTLRSNMALLLHSERAVLLMTVHCCLHLWSSSQRSKTYIHVCNELWTYLCLQSVYSDYFQLRNVLVYIGLGIWDISLGETQLQR